MKPALPESRRFALLISGNVGVMNLRIPYPGIASYTVSQKHKYPL
jgi:hypothetical protein